MRNPDALWRLHVVLAQILTNHDLPQTVTEFEQAIALKPDDSERRDRSSGCCTAFPTTPTRASGTGLDRP